MKKPSPTYRTLIAGMAVLLAHLFGACANDNQLESLDGVLRLLDDESRKVCFRYTDYDGFPIQAAQIRFGIQGATAGAILEQRVAVTDAEGIACVGLRTRKTAQFQVVADADDSGNKAATSVLVSDHNGGILEVLVYKNSEATVTEAQVIIAENFDCDFLNPGQPPAGSTTATNSNQTIVVQGQGGTQVKFDGLQTDRNYSVIALGRSNEQTTTFTCQDGITVKQEDIDKIQPVNLSLYLGDFIPNYSGNHLLITTDFDVPLGLEGIAGLLEQMSSRALDPALYILDQMELRVDGYKKDAILLFKNPIAQEMSGGEAGQAARMSLHQAARTLKDVKNVRLITQMELQDEAEEDGQRKAQLTGIHRFSHFEADVDGLLTKFDFRSGQQRLIDRGNLVLEATTELRVDNAERIAIEPHQMSLPVADAIVGKVFVDNFGRRELDKIIPTMINCSALGTKVMALTMGGASWSFDLETVLKGIAGGVAGIWVNDACRDTVTEIVNEVYDTLIEDLEAVRMDRDVTFDGQADVKRMEDNQRIGRLINGKWDEIGKFRAVRK